MGTLGSGGYGSHVYLHLYHDVAKGSRRLRHLCKTSLDRSVQCNFYHGFSTILFNVWNHTYYGLYKSGELLNSDARCSFIKEALPHAVKWGNAK